MGSQSKVCFFFDNVRLSLYHRTELKSFIEGLFRAEGRPLASLNYIFCSDERLLEINQQYLAHDYYTDIITFDFSAPGQPTEGEIYISVDRVRENASALGTAFGEELRRVVFHGALHLCGYKDKKKGEQQEMRKMEDHYLQRYKRYVPRGK